MKLRMKKQKIEYRVICRSVDRESSAMENRSRAIRSCALLVPKFYQDILRPGNTCAGIQLRTSLFLFDLRDRSFSLTKIDDQVARWRRTTDAPVDVTRR